MQMIVLGRQPELSLAELESLFGADKITRLASDLALLNDRADIDRLGGALKIAEVIHETTNTRHSGLAEELAALLDKPDSKYNLGVSWHPSADGQAKSAKDANALALEMKKLLKVRGHKVRVVPASGSGELSSAQVWHNRLDKEPNTELVLAEKNGKITAAKTTQVQDIEAYAARDQGRPMRDARVGMLPPKLAQIMVNLAGLHQGRILDPFVGTGVILQEAGRLGYPVYGTDMEARMIDYTRANLQAQELKADLETADARTHSWQPPIDAVVSETYLGPPLHTVPAQGKIDTLAQASGQLMTKFLKNIGPQLASGAPLVLAVPAWQTKDGKLTRSTVVDQIEHLGYTRRSFKMAEDKDLIYRRPDQVVGRELLVLTRN
jgi:tRNA G10  N-methylase Trm11